MCHVILIPFFSDDEHVSLTLPSAWTEMRTAVEAITPIEHET